MERKSDMIASTERCVSSYSTGDIEALKASYAPQEEIRLTFAPGPYILDT